jgi:hypothetical protein
VGLLILDEVHLLGEERGPVLEVIVSRMRFIASQADAGGGCGDDAASSRGAEAGDPYSAPAQRSAQPRVHAARCAATARDAQV